MWLTDSNTLERRALGRAPCGEGGAIIYSRLLLWPLDRRKDDGQDVSFKQHPPRLGNQYDDDRALRSLLRRALPPEVLAEVEPSLAEMGELAGESDDERALLLRLLTPIMKLTTTRQAGAVASETLECFGGAGYVEDTGLPVLLRDAQVLTIWEGTTNVLALDALRVIGKDERALAILRAEIGRCAGDVRDERLKDATRAALTASDDAARWLAQVEGEGRPSVEAGARRLALTLGRSYALSLLARHAQWSLDAEGDVRALASARRFAASGVNLITRTHLSDALTLSDEK